MLDGATVMKAVVTAVTVPVVLSSAGWTAVEVENAGTVG
jgi:hypothetical protein